jgi:hypothetical protein
MERRSAKWGVMVGTPHRVQVASPPLMMNRVANNRQPAVTTTTMGFMIRIPKQAAVTVRRHPATP